MNDAPMFEIVASPEGLRLVGDIDASSVELLAEYLAPLPGDRGDVMLDLSEVEFIDSSGLRALIDAHERADRCGRALVLAEPSLVVRRLLDISGLVPYLHIVPSED